MNNNNINQDINQDINNVSSGASQFNGYGDIIIPGFNDGYNDNLATAMEISDITNFTSNYIDSGIATDPFVIFSDSSDSSDSSDGTDSIDSIDGTDSIDSTDSIDGIDGTDSSDETDSIDGIDGTDSSDETDIATDSDSVINNNQYEEKNTVTGVVRTTQTESPFCDVCYIDLTLDNNVTSKCNHHFCNTCFFRWIEVNATCPSCRAPIDSNTNLSEEQFERETQEVYVEYTNLLRRSCNQLSKIKDRRFEMYCIREKTDSLLRRQISLIEQMRQTEGYNEGYMTAAYKFFHGEKEMKDSALLTANRNKNGFMKGYRAGIDVESRRLNKLAKKFKLISKKNIKIKKRKIQKTLWDCGITDNDDLDPIEGANMGTIPEEDMYYR